MEFGINDWRNAIFESDLSPKARLVGLALAKYYRQGKECFPSYRTLWADTGYTNNHTIAEAINELKESGFIRIKKGKIKNLSIQSQAYEFVGVTGELTGEVTGELTGEVTGEKNSPEIREEENKIILPPDNNKLLSSPKGENKPSVKKFKKPTIEEINAYCVERKNNVSPDRFFNFYESKGWRVGNQAMKDWKAAVRTWERPQTDKHTSEHSLDWL